MSQTKVIYQVSDLANEMRSLLERSYPEIWIEGELSSLSTPASGHLYFTLKDDDSQLRCAMFRSRANLSRYKPAAGDLVRIRAKISVYTARGDLQCIVQHIEDAGEGVLQRRFEELKDKLNKLGVFDQARKQAIPKFAKHIGIVTSPSGAAVRDIISTFKRRCPGLPVTIYPAVVQGESAPDSIRSALASAIQHERCDVIVLTRGGGSMEDLWCFNDEQLAHDIVNCPIPIVSGVGHEVDITICDLVADLRAPTPTAAAEILSPDTSQLLGQLQSMAFRLPRSMERLLQRLSQNVDVCAQRLEHPKQKLDGKRGDTFSLAKRLRQATLTQQKYKSDKQSFARQRLISQQPGKQIIQGQFETQRLGQQLQRASQSQLLQTRQKFESMAEQLNLVNPLATLDRGFSVTRRADKSVLRKSKQVAQGDKIDVQLSEGELHCEVLEISS